MGKRDLGVITCTYLYVRMCPLFNIFSVVIIVIFYINKHTLLCIDMINQNSCSSDQYSLC